MHAPTRNFMLPTTTAQPFTLMEDPPDLGCWPLLNREQVIRHRETLIATDVHFAQICHTSGSTGPSLDIYKSFEELRFVYDYYEAMFSPLIRRLVPVPLNLSLPTAYHGVPMRVPSIGKVFVSGVTDNTLIQDASKLLMKEYSIPGHATRISTISGMLFHIHFFTSFLIEQGITPADLGVRAIIVCGGYASRAALKFLRDSWNAEIHDRFSLTESVGGANRSWEDGLFRMDPHVIAEAVDVDSGMSVPQGVGYLVLTQLHPFVQMNPLIRYNTGDLVRRVPNPDEDDCFVFEFLGKASNCISWQPEGSSEWLIFSTDYYDILCDIPDVNLIEWFANVTVAHDRGVGSKPIQRSSTSLTADGHLMIHLEIELRYAPHCFPNQITKLRDQIINGLASKNLALAKRLLEKSVSIDISFSGPGSLHGASVIKV